MPIVRNYHSSAQHFLILPRCYRTLHSGKVKKMGLNGDRPCFYWLSRAAYAQHGDVIALRGMVDMGRQVCSDMFHQAGC